MSLPDIGFGSKTNHDQIGGTTYPRYMVMYAERKETSDSTPADEDPAFGFRGATTHTTGTDAKVYMGILNGVLPTPEHNITVSNLSAGIVGETDRVTVHPGIVLNPTTTTIAPDVKGSLMYDSGSDELKYYDGSWQIVSAGGLSAHVLDSETYHTATGLTVGWVISADSATTFSWKAPTGGGPGSGTQWTLPVWDTTSTLGDSMISQNSGGTAATIGGTTTISTINAGVADYDKFLVSDTGLIKFRTGAEAYSDMDGYVTADFTTDFAAESLANLTTRAHSDLSDAPTDAHHSETHVLAVTGPHTGTLPWTDLNKTGSSLADLATRTHGSLSDAPTSAHHVRYADSEVRTVITAECAEEQIIDDAIDALIVTHAGLPTVHQNAPGLISTHAGLPSVHHTAYTDTMTEAVITAELVDGQSIDNAIDSLISSHAGDDDAHHALVTVQDSPLLLATQHITFLYNTNHFSLGVDPEELLIGTDTPSTDEILTWNGTDAVWSALTVGAHVLATTGPHTGSLPWSDLSKTGSSLADLATRAHSNLSDAPADAHHVAFILSDFTTAFAAESLANLATRNHASLSDAPTSAHHVRYADSEVRTVITAECEEEQIINDAIDGLIYTHAGLATVHQDAPALISTHAGVSSAHHTAYTDAMTEAVITAEIVNGQSIDNAIDSLISTHAGDNDAHHALVTVTATPLTLSGQAITFNYNTNHFKLTGSNLEVGTDTPATDEVLTWNGSAVVWAAAGGGGPHTHDGDTLQIDGINSDGGAFAFDTTGAVTFNQSIVTTGDLTVVGDMAADNLVYEGEYLSLTEGLYGQQLLRTTHLNNVFYAADKRFTITKTGNTTAYIPAQLFNGNLGSAGALRFVDGETVTLNFDLVAKSEYTGNGLVYSYGPIIVHFYYTYHTTNVRARLFTKNADGAHAWRGWIDGVDISNNGNYHVMSINMQGNYYCQEVEIEFTASGNDVYVAEIEWNMDRNVDYRAFALMRKYADNSMYGYLFMKNSSNVTTATLTTAGALTLASNLTVIGNNIYGSSTANTIILADNLQIKAVADIRFYPTGETDDYMRFTSDGSNPRLSSVGSGQLQIYSDGSMKIWSASYLNLQAAGGAHMYFDAGGVFYWRDEDAADATRMSLNSATGELTLAGHFMPGTHFTYDLGSTSVDWRKLWVGNIETSGNILPNVNKTRDIGLSGMAYDECYADNWHNVSSWKEFADPLAILGQFGPTLENPYEIDHSKVDDWMRARVKARVLEQADCDTVWEGGYILKDKKAKKNARVVEHGKDKVKVKVGNYSDGYSDEDFEHEDAYSINKTQIVMIQAIKQLEQRIIELEDAS